MENKKKKCVSCGLVKIIDEFGKDKYSSDGLTYSCKKCRNDKYNERAKNNPESVKLKNNKQKENRKKYYNSQLGIESSRRSHLKTKYNITLEEYNELSEKQNHLCGICGKSEIYYRNKVLCVDHCHETNVIRGLLCNTCNRAIGLLKDDVNVLLKAIEYLKK